MICTWLVEIMLHQINSYEESVRSSKATLDRKMQGPSRDNAAEFEKKSIDLSTAMNEFRKFLTDYKVRKFILNH